MIGDQSAAAISPPRASIDASAIDASAIDAVRRLERRRPTEPWVPRHCRVFPVKAAKVTRSKGKDVACWDVRWRVDGWEFQRRFARPSGTSEQARTWAQGLAEGYARGWAFDPESRRFLNPAVRASDTAAELARDGEEEAGNTRPTVATTAVDYLRRRWPAWSPKSRQAAVLALKRACVHLLRAGAPEAPENLAGYLDWLLQPVRGQPPSGDGTGILAHGVPEELITGASYLSEWSLPLAEVTWEMLEGFLTRYERSERFPGRPVAASTRQRFVADVRQFVSESTIRCGLSDPWPALQRMTRGRRSQPNRVVPVDAELVLSPEEVFALAQACAEHGSWGTVVICFVLVMGFCGLRPGEAVGLRIVDLDLPDAGPGWLTVRRSPRDVTERWLDPEEDREWGPLKGKEIRDSRRAPVPTRVVAELRRHLAAFRSGAKPSSLAFLHHGERFDMDAFAREVWGPALASLFPADPDLSPDDPAQPKRSRLRRHDLRHAACSLWLASGVDLKVCQRWSGHATLSVFLDVYQGILPGREEEGVAAIDCRLAGLGTGPSL